MKRQQFLDSPAMISDTSGHRRGGPTLSVDQTRMGGTEIRDRSEKIHPMPKRYRAARQGPTSACQRGQTRPEDDVQSLDGGRIDDADALRLPPERFHACRRAIDNAIVGGVIPKEYIPAIEAGVVEAMQRGVLAGCPMVDVQVSVYDGSYHEVDSSEVAFKIAASMAFKDIAKSAEPVLLEPIMDVEVVVPNESMGDVIGDLTSRRGRIRGMEEQAGAKIIRAHVPLAEMFGYATALRSRTQGRATFTMQFALYEEAPASQRAAVTTA